MLKPHGMTLVELLAAAVIGSLIAGGALMAFATAVRLSQRSSKHVQVGHYAQETLEKLRNHIACDDPWYDAACAPKSQTNVNDLPGGAPAYITGRRYDVKPVNGAPQAAEVQVTVTWNPPQ